MLRARRKIRRVSLTLAGGSMALFLFCMMASPVAADETSLTLLQSGDDEREDAGGTCLQEPDFLAGTISAALHLKVGGESAGCDSEWATSVEFDLTGVPTGVDVFSATLIVHKTGYSDDSQGNPYVAAFAYSATGAPVSVPRDDLTPDTALDVVYPPATNVDLSFDVTPAVQQWVAGGETRAGLLLAGVFSEAGYENWISIGGTGHALAPRLIVTHEGPVATPSSSWSSLKTRFR